MQVKTAHTRTPSCTHLNTKPHIPGQLAAHTGHQAAHPAAHTRTTSCTYLDTQQHTPGHPAAHTWTTSCTYLDNQLCIKLHTHLGNQLHTPGQPAAHTRTTSCAHLDNKLHTPGQSAVHTRTTSCTHQDNQLHTPGQPAAHHWTASQHKLAMSSRHQYRYAVVTHNRLLLPQIQAENITSPEQLTDTYTLPKGSIERAVQNKKTKKTMQVARRY